MNKLKPVALALVLTLLNTLVMAQQQNTLNNTSTDFMRSEGKLYVVLAVIVTIVAGIFIYLVNLDKKITKLEKGNKN